MQIRWSKNQNFAWELGLSDSAYFNYVKKSGSQLLAQMPLTFTFFRNPTSLRVEPVQCACEDVFYIPLQIFCHFEGAWFCKFFEGYRGHCSNRCISSCMHLWITRPQQIATPTPPPHPRLPSSGNNKKRTGKTH